MLYSLTHIHVMALTKLKPSHLILPIVGLVAAGLLLMKKGAATLGYYIQKVGISIDGFTPILRLDVGVQNPSNQSFTIRSIAGSVTVDGQPVGTVSMFETIVVAPVSQAIIPVYIRLSPLAIVSDLVSIITKGSGIPKTIVFNGYVNVNELVDDVQLTYKLS